MQEIKCPNCGKTFVVDDAGYAQIVRQVRDSEFDRELLKREKDIADAKAREAELAQMRQKEAFDRALGEREKRIEQLSAQLTGSETEKQLAVSEAVGKQAEKLAEAERRVEQLKAQLASGETEKQLAVSEAVGKQAEKLAEAERRVEQLKAQLQGGEADKKLAVSEAVREKEKELSEQAAEMAEYTKDRIIFFLCLPMYTPARSRCFMLNGVSRVSSTSNLLRAIYTTSLSSSMPFCSRNTSR